MPAGALDHLATPHRHGEHFDQGSRTGELANDENAMKPARENSQCLPHLLRGSGEVFWRTRVSARTASALSRSPTLNETLPLCQGDFFPRTGRVHRIPLCG